MMASEIGDVRSLNEGDTGDLDQDTISLVTTFSQQLDEMRRQEIRYENLKPLATSRSSKYDNDAVSLFEV